MKKIESPNNNNTISQVKSSISPPKNELNDTLISTTKKIRFSDDLDDKKNESFKKSIDELSSLDKFKREKTYFEFKVIHTENLNKYMIQIKQVTGIIPIIVLQIRLDQEDITRFVMQAKNTLKGVFAEKYLVIFMGKFISGEALCWDEVDDGPTWIQFIGVLSNSKIKIHHDSIARIVLENFTIEALQKSFTS